MTMRLVVIGASAGGISAVRQLLAALPADYPLPLVVVQHLQASTNVDFALVFGTGGLTVKEAEDKEPVAPGTVYIAPPGYHLLCEKDLSLSLSVEEPENFSRPSIDVLFETAAAAVGARLVGVVLTGGNHDGARGLAAIKAAGGCAVVQDPVSAEVGAMPKAALRAVPDADRVLAIEDIGPFLLEIGKISGKEGRHP